MKPFDLEAAKAGKAVVTRNGKLARIICTDRESDEKEPILALVKDRVSGHEAIYSYHIDGIYYEGKESPHDLFMAPTTKEIVFEGVTYTVPVWVKFVARDHNKAIWGYENKPRKDFEENCWGGNGKGKATRMENKIPNWEDSLQEYQ